jgi:hypothetical protein
MRFLASAIGQTVLTRWVGYCAMMCGISMMNLILSNGSDRLQPMQTIGYKSTVHISIEVPPYSIESLGMPVVESTFAAYTPCPY